jgi:D-sedoheptulose 7-phosphate isomerase
MFMLEQRIQQQFFDSADLQYQTAETLSRPLAEAAAALHGTITAGGKVMVVGQWQAAALAGHAAALLVGRFERERPPLAALALGANGTAAKQLQALGHPGDALLLLDAGDGDAHGARAAIEAAHAKEMTVVLIAGGAGNAAQTLREALAETDVMIAVPHERAVRVLELQMLALHCLCDAIDTQLMGDIEP